MNIGAFFATMMAFGPNDAPPPPQVMTAPPAVERTVPASGSVQLAAAPTETEPATVPTPSPAPAAKPKATTTRPAAAKGTSPAAKPKATTQRNPPPPQRKTPVVAKPRSSAKTPVAGTCPAGSVKSATTGRCVPRTGTSQPRA